MLHSTKKTPEREEWWAISDQTGEVFGPFDPGTVWFETPLHVRGGDLLRLQRVADLILNEAHAGWERLQRVLAFMQPNGSAVYRRFMDSGVLPRQTPALGLAGGLDVPGYLGDGGATGAGLHVDDAHNGTTVSGGSGGGGASNPGRRGGSGGGIGGGSGGGGSGTANGSAQGGGGGGYGSEGSDGNASTWAVPTGGQPISVHQIWGALQANSFTRSTLEHGGGGGGGGRAGDSGSRGGDGGDGGSAYIAINGSGILTVIGRALTGSSGSNGVRGSARSSGYGSGGGGAGGLWFGVASRIVYGSGTIDVGGGSRGTAGADGGDGGNGRVVQVYFDSKADNLQVTGGVQDQFRILRSVPIGQNTFL